MLRLTALAVAAFLAILIAQFPARWSSWALPRGISCRQLDGSIWSGRCAGLAAHGMQLGDAAWTLHPLALLRGRFDTDVVLERADGSLRGNLALGLGGRIEAHDLSVRDLRLDRLGLSQLPPGLHGTAQARIATALWSGNRLAALAGQVQVQGLTDAEGTSLGDYQLEFPDIPAGGEPTGMLRDTGGPLRVAGQLRLTREPGFELSGRVAARPSAAPGLTEQIRYLGSADAEGMRPFSIAGTF